MNEPFGISRSRSLSARRGASSYERLLIVLFLVTLPLVNPWVRGDGIGYYAYARALLIQGNLRFESDWMAGNNTFLMHRVDASGRLQANQFTSTGYVNNHFSVGPAMLWAPFLAVAHVAVLGLNRLGLRIPADGFSSPYRVTMAAATALYAFLGLCLAFRLARKYFEERWAFLATVGIWFASSLPVYMYFNPSWSHAHSVFAVALFLWYWDHTRGGRTLGQWAALGALSGLMVNVYYVNGVLLLVPMLEAVADYERAWQLRETRRPIFHGLLVAHGLYVAVVLITLLPTLVTRKIIFGHPLHFGAYTETHWEWISPTFWSLLFSSNHGLLTWTPILILAAWGLLLFWRRDKAMATYLLVASLAFSYVIASYPTWHGLSSYGNRFFVSLTPVFILGLAALLDRFGEVFESSRNAFTAAWVVASLFVVWNAGFIFQWGTHMIPVRGTISFREMAYNQVAVVPGRLTYSLRTYLLQRKLMMEHIEQEDVKQLKSRTLGGE